MIGPTAIIGFSKWPQMLERHEEIAHHPLFALHSPIGERIQGPTVSFFGTTSQQLYRHSRPKLHRMLLEQLAKSNVEVEYGLTVAEYFENTPCGRAGVMLKDGSKHEADLVVAADGVRGNSWPLIAGKPVPARSSGRAIFRVAYPVELARADPMVAERFKLQEDGKSVLEFWTG